MTSAPQDLTRLVSLIQAAREEMERLGVDGEIKRGLETALLAAQAANGRGGKPDEGIRPEKLTGANDG